MLSTIKNMIKEQKTFLEAAELLLENEELDDSVVLGEEETFEGIEDKETDADDIEDVKDDDKDDTVDDVKPAEEPVEKPVEGPIEPEENEVDDELPQPIGAQTGEPAQLDNSELLNVEIDPATNTQTDSLPVPPSNAGDAIDGDEDKVQVDSGFGGDIMDEPVEAPEEPAKAEEESDDILDADIEEAVLYPGIEGAETDEDDLEKEKCDKDDECGDKADKECDDKECDDKDKKCDEKEECVDEVTEAITVGDKPEGDQTEEEPAEDAEEVPDDDTPENKPEDNLVTAAVKDKVDEITNDSPAASQSSANVKDALLKKLSGLTKSLEDAKRAVMDNLR